MTRKFIQTKATSLTYGISSSTTTIQLSELLKLDGSAISASDIGDLLYGTFAPGTSREEIFSIVGSNVTVESDGKVTITGVNRGLKEVSPYGSGGYSCDHPASEVVVFGNNPQLYQWLKDYIDSAIVTGAVPATDAIPGIVIEATQAQLDAGTKQESYGGQDYDLIATPDKIRAKKYHDAIASAVGSDSYAITVVPAITAYANYQEFTFIADVANTGSCTLNVCGLGAKTIKKNVSDDLATGDILAGQIVKVIYDGTNMQLISKTAPKSPVVNIYSPIKSSRFGNNTSQFDITNPSGTTWRYTWDGTGANPNINTTNFPTGGRVVVVSDSAGSINVNNVGSYIITASGTNYFEVSKASGTAQNDITNIALYIITDTFIWTKPTGLSYIEVEVQGASDGLYENVTNSTGGGGYAKKIYKESDLSSTESVIVGFKGFNNSVAGGGSNTVANASASTFKSITANPSSNITGGSASGGDINISGQNGTTHTLGGRGGSSILGLGGVETSGNSGQGTGYGAGSSAGDGTSIGNSGLDGVIIIKEYF